MLHSDCPRQLTNHIGQQCFPFNLFSLGFQDAGLFIFFNLILFEDSFSCGFFSLYMLHKRCFSPRFTPHGDAIIKLITMQMLVDFHSSLAHLQESYGSQPHFPTSVP